MPFRGNSGDQVKIPGLGYCLKQFQSVHLIIKTPAMRRFILLLLFAVVTASLTFAQITKKDRVTAISTIRDHRTDMIASSTLNRDTIPISRYKYYKIDDSRYKIYLNSVVNKDSVKLLKATAQDWTEYATAYENLKRSFAKNAYNNVQNYIDTTIDFNELKLLNQKFLPHTAKVCLRQLTYNISLLNQLLAKPLNEKADLQLLTSVMNNINTLVATYIAPIGTTFAIRELFLPNLRIKVFGKDRVELNNAQCYFISNKTCRDIACMTCLPAMDPCDAGNINAIIGKADISYDCANPVAIKVNFGHYHIFVISRSKIVFSEMRNIDENSIASAENNEIKIFLQ